jgi:hypothetical protein
LDLLIWVKGEVPVDIPAFSASLQARLSGAANETEVRDRFCGEVYAKYGITFRLERGRSDARLHRLIMEFKDLGLFTARADSAKFREAYSQLTDKYIPDQAAKEALLISILSIGPL